MPAYFAARWGVQTGGVSWLVADRELYGADRRVSGALLAEKRPLQLLDDSLGAGGGSASFLTPAAATRRVGHSSGNHLPHPRHSLGREGRDKPGRIVPDTAPIGPAIVAAGENGPQVQRHLAIARQQGNGELGEGVLHFPGVYEEPARLVESMHGNVVVVQTSLEAQPFQGHGSCVFAAAEQIDFHQMDRAAQNFCAVSRYSSRPFSPGVLLARLRTSMTVTSRSPSSSRRVRISTSSSVRSSSVTSKTSGCVRAATATPPVSGRMSSTPWMTVVSGSTYRADVSIHTRSLISAK